MNIDFEVLKYKLKKLEMAETLNLLVYVYYTPKVTPERRKQVFASVDQLIKNIEERKRIDEAIEIEKEILRESHTIQSA
jgi:hypothetical protein